MLHLYRSASVLISRLKYIFAGDLLHGVASVGGRDMRRAQDGCKLTAVSTVQARGHHPEPDGTPCAQEPAIGAPWLVSSSLRSARAELLDPPVHEERADHRVGNNIDPMWKVLNKEVDLGEPTSFLDHEHLTQIQREISKDIVDNHRTMFESRISA